SRLTIATRVGSASALNRAASSARASLGSGTVSGPQQMGWRTGSACIDVDQCIIIEVLRGCPLDARGTSDRSLRILVSDWLFRLLFCIVRRLFEVLHDALRKELVYCLLGRPFA